MGKPRVPVLRQVLTRAQWSEARLISVCSGSIVVAQRLEEAGDVCGWLAESGFPDLVGCVCGHERWRWTV